LTIGTFIVQAIGAILSVILVVCLAPDASVNRALFCRKVKKASNRNTTPLLDDEAGDVAAGGVDISDSKLVAQKENTLLVFLRSSGNMMIRSLLLSVSIWMMGVYASNLGVAQLAAHQVSQLLQLEIL